MLIQKKARQGLRPADTAGWKFLTGSTQEILNVALQYEADYYGEPGKDLDHLVVTYLINQTGNVAQVLKGPNHTVVELSTAVETLLTPQDLLPD